MATRLQRGVRPDEGRFLVHDGSILTEKFATCSVCIKACRDTVADRGVTRKVGQGVQPVRYCRTVAIEHSVAKYRGFGRLTRRMERPEARQCKLGALIYLRIRFGNPREVDLPFEVPVLLIETRRVTAVSSFAVRARCTAARLLRDLSAGDVRM